MNLTALITCKDRVDNLKLCLASIRACDPRPHTIVVDFGSNPPLVFPKYKNWLKIIRVDKNTKMFHKARAINIGIKQVKTKFICITDADQIFKPNFFGVTKRALQKNPSAFVMCKTYFLYQPQKVTIFSDNGKQYYTLLKKAKKNGEPTHGDGCCNGVSTKWAMKVRGYDETYVGYRAQDSDFALRAMRAGLVKVWINNLTSMIHMPHARSGKYYSNSYVIINKQKYVATRKAPPRRVIVANKNKKWGQV